MDVQDLGGHAVPLSPPCFSYPCESDELDAKRCKLNPKHH